MAFVATIVWLREIVLKLKIQRYESVAGLPPNCAGVHVSVCPTLGTPVTRVKSCSGSAGNGSMTGLGSLMNDANAEVRMYTPGRCRRPHLASLTSGPQLVMPICTGPWDVWRMNGPPLSPGQACTSGARRDARSCPQISDAMIAWGYARLHAAGEMTFMCPVCRCLGCEVKLGPVRP